MHVASSCAEAWIRELKVLPYLLGAWLILVGLQTMRILVALCLSTKRGCGMLREPEHA